MQTIQEQEEKFEVDSDWVMPQLDGASAGRRRG